MKIVLDHLTKKFPSRNNDDLVEHVVLADVLQMPQGIMHCEIGMLGIHSQIITQRGNCRGRFLL